METTDKHLVRGADPGGFVTLVPAPSEATLARSVPASAPQTPPASIMRCFVTMKDWFVKVFFLEW
jgi:hypothetical protein